MQHNPRKPFDDDPALIWPDGDRASLSSACHFHLIALTPGFAHALVMKTERGWLLPSLKRHPWQTPPERALNVLRREATAARIVHSGLHPPNRLTLPVDDICIVALVSGPSRTNQTSLVPLSELHATTPLLAWQRHALATAIQRLEDPAASFDAVRQVHALMSWAENQIARRTGASIVAMTPLQCTRHDYIIRIHTNIGDMCLRSGPRRILDDAAAAQTLWVLSPRHFPATLCVDEPNGRWLYREPPGEPLVQPLLTIQSATLVASELAAVQKRTMAAASVEDMLASRRLNAAQLLTHVQQIVWRTWPDSPASEGDAALLAQWNSSVESIWAVCAGIDELRLPLTLVLSDLNSFGIFASSGSVGFTNLGNSFWSYPFLSIWRYFRDVNAKLNSAGQVRRPIERAFANEWADVVRPADMNLALNHMTLLGSLFDLLLNAQRLDMQEHDLGEPLPPWYRAARLAPALSRVLDHSPTQRSSESTASAKSISSAVV